MQPSRAANGEDLRIEACEGIKATDDPSGRAIMLGFYRKGVAVLLTYDEAPAPATLMEMGVKQRKAEEQALRRT